MPDVSSSCIDECAMRFCYLSEDGRITGGCTFALRICSSLANLQESKILLIEASAATSHFAYVAKDLVRKEAQQNLLCHPLQAGTDAVVDKIIVITTEAEEYASLVFNKIRVIFTGKHSI